MKLSARQIAEHLGGDIIGNPDVQVSSPARIEYGKNGNICFLANPKYEKYLYSTGASIVLVNRSFTPREPVKATMIAVDDAYQAVAELLVSEEETGLTARDANRVFEAGGVWEFISSCYDSLHLSSDIAALDDVFARLDFKGVSY